MYSYILQCLEKQQIKLYFKLLVFKSKVLPTLRYFVHTLIPI